MARYKYLQNGEDKKNHKNMWMSSYSLGPGVRCLTRSYCVWVGLLSRVTPFGVQQRKHPNYIGTSNLFKDFQEFAEWCQTSANYLNKEQNGKFWQLDKDIIVPFNKTYSPETCCFVPNEINGLLTWRTGDRGKLPLGVVEDKGRGNCPIIYRAYCNVDGRQVALGRRKTPEDAHVLWQKAKVNEIYKKANKYKNLPDNVRQGLYLHAELIETDIRLFRETVR